MARKARLGKHLYWRGGVIYGWFWQPLANGDRTQVKRSTGCTDPDAAATVLAGWEKETGDPTASARRDATLEDAFDLFIKDRAALIAQGKRSEDSEEFYKKCARAWYLYAGRLIDRVPDERLDKKLKKEERDALVEKGKAAALITIDKRFTRGFVEHRRAGGTSDSTIAKNRGAMKSALWLARDAGIWRGDLDELFPPGFGSGYEPKRIFLTHAQGTRLLAKFGAQRHRRAQVAFALATGAEKRAIDNALRSDVSTKLVHLRGTKTPDRDRSVPIVTPWQTTLIAYAKRHGDGEDGALFTDWANSTRDLELACLRAKVPIVSMHGLRHTFGRWMLDEGATESEVAMMLGHRDTRMVTLIYGRVDGLDLHHRVTERIADRAARKLHLIQGGQADETPKKRAKG